MTTKQKDYLSTREAAELLNVAVSTIQLWTDNGMLHAWTTVGGHRRIDKNSVNQMLSQKQVSSNKNNCQQSISIVVIEEDEQEQILYKQNFDHWHLNANVLIAKNVYSGLINVGQLLPDIIISDLMMSDMNGFEMIKAIKEDLNLKSCLIIAVSALTESEIKVHGGLPPDVFVFKKPLLFGEVEELIRKKVESSVA